MECRRAQESSRVGMLCLCRSEVLIQGTVQGVLLASESRSMVSLQVSLLLNGSKGTSWDSQAL